MAYAKQTWEDGEVPHAAKFNHLEDGIENALSKDEAAKVATSGSYNDLNNKPTIPPAYTLPYATSSVLGGVKPLWKIAEATQPVYVDSAGRLYTVPSSSGGGVTTDMADTLYALLEKCAYISDDVTAEVNAFKSAWNIGGDTPVPPTPEKTLQSITVTWFSDSADVGTNPETLISAVTAHYSDGSTETVSGYTVTPSALVEGEQNVTVAYNGKTATKQITGNAHPSVSEVLTIKRATSTPPSASNGYAITFTENTGYKNAGTEWSENEGTELDFGTVDGNRVQAAILLQKSDGSVSFTKWGGSSSDLSSGDITLIEDANIQYCYVAAVAGKIYLPYSCKVRLYFRNATDMTGIIDGLHVELRG